MVLLRDQFMDILIPRGQGADPGVCQDRQVRLEDGLYLGLHLRDMLDLHPTLPVTMDLTGPLRRATWSHPLQYNEIIIPCIIQ